MADRTYLTLARTAIVYFCAAAAVIVALIVLFGWFANIPSLRSLVPGYPEMQPNTAIAFAVAGIGLLMQLRADQGSGWKYAAVFCGILVSLTGVCDMVGLYFGLQIESTPVCSSRQSRSGRSHPGRLGLIPRSTSIFRVFAA